MEEKKLFSFHYSAKENNEIQEIRKKYLPQEESKLDTLKRLDRHVQNAGQLQSLIVGVTGCLIFGFGMCLSLKVIGNSFLLGIPFGIVGAACMLAAYPLYRKIFKSEKEKFAPKILELSAELSQSN